MQLSPEVLKILRAGLGEAQEEFSHRIGLGRSLYSLIEARIRRLLPEHAKEIMESGKLDPEAVVLAVRLSKRLSAIKEGAKE